MKLTAPLIVALVALATVAGHADSEGLIYTESFDSAALPPEWKAVEGNWSVVDGALTTSEPGLIVLDKPLGSRFTVEAEVNLPPNWVSLILFYVSPDDYGTLYFGGGYWESFEIDDKDFSDYVQRRDTTITPGVDRRIKAVAEYGQVTLTYDDQLKGTVNFRPRPGARLAIKNISAGGLLQLKSLRITEPPPMEIKPVRQLRPADLAASRVYADYNNAGAPEGESPLSGDPESGVGLSYSFEPNHVFQGRFARIPLEAARCSRLIADVEGDGSGNSLFVILHDSSGEQHLVAQAVLAWEGRQELAVNFTGFLEPPTERQRFHTRWGGDQNQVIDFPITAIDIGIAKRGARTKDSGQVKLRELRLVE